MCEADYKRHKPKEPCVYLPLENSTISTEYCWSRGYWYLFFFSFSHFFLPLWLFFWVHPGVRISFLFGSLFTSFFLYLRLHFWQIQKCCLTWFLDNIIPRLDLILFLHVRVISLKVFPSCFLLLFYWVFIRIILCSFCWATIHCNSM